MGAGGGEPTSCCDESDRRETDDLPPNEREVPTEVNNLHWSRRPQNESFPAWNPWGPRRGPEGAPPPVISETEQVADWGGASIVDRSSNPRRGFASVSRINRRTMGTRRPRLIAGDVDS